MLVVLPQAVRVPPVSAELDAGVRESGAGRWRNGGRGRASSGTADSVTARSSPQVRGASPPSAYHVTAPGPQRNAEGERAGSRHRLTQTGELPSAYGEKRLITWGSGRSVGRVAVMRDGSAADVFRTGTTAAEADLQLISREEPRFNHSPENAVNRTDVKIVFSVPIRFCDFNN